MKIGLVLPVVVQHPSARAEWERDAGIDEVARIGAAADRLGYHHIACSEHVAVPQEIAVERGGTYWDPLSTLGFVAAHTSRIRLATQVLVLGYHHPLEIAKRYGTLDRISGGRIVLGLGVGSLREEFDLLGAPFEDRGARADDAIRALRSSLSEHLPSYSGTFYSYDGFVVEPHATQARVPLWIGGRTRRSLRRAAEFGDGWVPFGLSVDELRTMLDAADLPSGFDLVLNSGRRLDPLGDRDATLRSIARVSEAGATILGISLVSTDAEHYCDQLGELRELAVQAGCTFDPDPGDGRDH